MTDVCPYNAGIRCDQQDACELCGWNPEEAAKRKNRIAGTVEVYDETTQKVIGRLKWPVLGCMSDRFF